MIPGDGFTPDGSLAIRYRHRLTRGLDPERTHRALCSVPSRARTSATRPRSPRPPRTNPTCVSIGPVPVSVPVRVSPNEPTSPRGPPRTNPLGFVLPAGRPPREHHPNEPSDPRERPRTNPIPVSRACARDRAGAGFVFPRPARAYQMVHQRFPEPTRRPGARVLEQTQHAFRQASSRNERPGVVPERTQPWAASSAGRVRFGFVPAGSGPSKGSIGLAFKSTGRGVHRSESARAGLNLVDSPPFPPALPKHPRRRSLS
jgi:hypothetical protein